MYHRDDHWLQFLAICPADEMSVTDLKISKEFVSVEFVSVAVAKFGRMYEVLTHILESKVRVNIEGGKDQDDGAQ